jgi:hypothetical protein
VVRALAASRSRHGSDRGPRGAAAPVSVAAKFSAKELLERR